MSPSETRASCAACGHENPDGNHFCGGCDDALDAAPPASRDAVRAPRAYTPKHLADEIVQSKSALEGERKLVTVGCADVKSSTERTEQLDPDEWHRILGRFFEILAYCEMGTPLQAERVARDLTE